MKIENLKKDIEKYAKINDIDDVDNFIFLCFKQGFDIKKYGLIGENNYERLGRKI
jgi:hypothetical protein